MWLIADYLFKMLSMPVKYFIPHLLLDLTAFMLAGTTVYVESSPFGSLVPGVFLNSLSSGIISNVGNTAADIMLTDARCIMGSEGAPVFAVIEGM